MTKFNRLVSKFIFAVIFLSSFYFITHKIAAIPDTPTETLTQIKCEDICGKYSKNDSTIRNFSNISIVHEYCGSLWKYKGPLIKIHSNFDFLLPRYHWTILLILSGLFILSTIEGLMDAYVPCTPFNILVKMSNPAMEGRIQYRPDLKRFNMFL